MKNQTSQNFTMAEEGNELSLLWLHSKPQDTQKTIIIPNSN